MVELAEKIVLEKSHENEEMYLKAIWLLEEEKVNPIHASEVAKQLNVSLPSMTEMLKKLDEKVYLQYSGRDGVKLEKKGRAIAETIIRNLRLTELFFRDILKIDFNDESVCRFEHVITDEIAEAMKRLLKNPKKCPHGKKIPAV